MNHLIDFKQRTEARLAQKELPSEFCTELKTLDQQLKMSLPDI